MPSQEVRLIFSAGSGEQVDDICEWCIRKSQLAVVCRKRRQEHAQKALQQERKQ